MQKNNTKKTNNNTRQKKRRKIGGGHVPGSFVGGAKRRRLGKAKSASRFFFRRQEIVNIDKRQYTSFSGCECFSVLETLSGLFLSMCKERGNTIATATTHSTCPHHTTCTTPYFQTTSIPLNLTTNPSPPSTSLSGLAAMALTSTVHPSPPSSSPYTQQISLNGTFSPSPKI